MIAALTLGEPFGTELAVVCTALFPQRSTPWAARALGFRFQRVELEYAVPNH